MSTESGKPELFDELNQLVKSMAQALELPEPEVVTALEQNEAEITLERLPDGRRVIVVGIAGRRATIGLGPAE